MDERCVLTRGTSINMKNSFVDHNLKGPLAGLPCFYCRGAWDYERMSFVHKKLCRMLQKAVGKKKTENRELWENALMEAGEEKHDWTDKAYIAPILETVREDSNDRQNHA